MSFRGWPGRLGCRVLRGLSWDALSCIKNGVQRRGNMKLIGPSTTVCFSRARSPCSRASVRIVRRSPGYSGRRRNLGKCLNFQPSPHAPFRDFELQTLDSALISRAPDSPSLRKYHPPQAPSPQLLRFSQTDQDKGVNPILSQAVCPIVPRR